MQSSKTLFACRIRISPMSVWSRQLLLGTRTPIVSGTASPTWPTTAKAIAPTSKNDARSRVNSSDMAHPNMFRWAERRTSSGVNAFEALAHPSQRLVENLHLFAALFVGGLGGATGTFGLHSRGTLAPQQAEILVARIPEPALQIFQRLRVHTGQSVGMSLGDQRVFLRGQVHMVVAHL